MGEKNNATIEITADTAEFDQAVDRCMIRLQELIRLGEQANKVLDTEHKHEKATVDDQLAEIRTHIVDMIQETANAVFPADHAADIATLVHAYCETFNI